MPKVSVLMPTYNHAGFIEEAIKSVLSQTFQDFEFIILDNCSTDNTKNIIEKYKSDGRIKYYVNEKNIGNINNFNKSLEMANCEYIKFLFSDDLLAPDALNEFVKIMDEHDDVSLATSYFQYTGSAHVIHKQPFTLKVSGYEAIKQTLGNNLIGAPSNVIFRKSVYSKLKHGFRTEFKWWVDLEFWHRLLENNYLYVIPKVLSEFKVHELSASQDCVVNFDNVYDEYFYLKEIRDKKRYYPLYNDLVFKSRLKIAAEQFINLMGNYRKSHRWDLVKKAIIISVKERLFFSLGLKHLKQFYRKITFTI